MRILLLIAIVAFVTLSSFYSEPVSSKSYDMVTDDSVIFQKAEIIISAANTLKPKTEELKKIFEGYKEKAKKCPKALVEAKDGVKLAQEASKSCDEAKHLVLKAKLARKDLEANNLIHDAEKKIHRVNFLMREADDRKKEVEFELKGCKG